MLKRFITAGIVMFALVLVLASCSRQEKVEANVAHILIQYKGSMRAPETITRSKEEAKVFTEELLKRIKAGEDFFTLARENSDCPSKANDGRLGRFKRGMMAPPFEEAAFKLKKDKISGIVETDFGFHILKALE